MDSTTRGVVALVEQAGLMLGEDELRLVLAYFREHEPWLAAAAVAWALAVADSASERPTDV